MGVPISRISRLSIWESQKNLDLVATPVASHKKYYKGGRW